MNCVTCGNPAVMKKALGSFEFWFCEKESCREVFADYYAKKFAQGSTAR